MADAKHVRRVGVTAERSRWKSPVLRLVAVFASVVSLGGAGRARADVAFLGQAFAHAGYDYAPSFMFGDGPEIRSWWCGQGPGGDNVFHASWGPSGWHDIRVVLAPTPGSWDAAHACDPSVVMGSFTFGGTAYRYAMYYTGTDRPESSGIENRIGVAVSNDGLSWVKVPAPVVSPAVLPSGTYGAGMPSAWSPGGSEVWLTYLDSTASPANGIFLRQSADGTTFGPAVATSLDGGRGQQGADIAYDGEAHRWFAAVKMDRDLNVILLQSCGDPDRGADSILARWIEIGFLNGTNTGRPMNHNPGLLRWPGGNARHDEAASFFVQFGWGDFDPATWELAWGRFTAAPDGDGDCHLGPAD
ncbi:MAG: hypothetical protein QME96_18615, partial [Myxococcota bacterium]|nr:hypothetical protein [Myxococcota bacterium]